VYPFGKPSSRQSKEEVSVKGTAIGGGPSKASSLAERRPDPPKERGGTPPPPKSHILLTWRELTGWTSKGRGGGITIDPSLNGATSTVAPCFFI